MEGSFTKGWGRECSPSVYEALGSISRSMKNNKTKQQPQKPTKVWAGLRKPKGLTRLSSSGLLCLLGQKGYRVEINFHHGLHKEMS